MSDTIRIFNRGDVRRNRNRAKVGQRFLHEWTASALSKRLDDIKRSFGTGLLIGFNPEFNPAEKIKYPIMMDISENILAPCSGITVQGDEEYMPIKTGSLDIILSCLSLHSVNDLPGALIQMFRSLKPDGAFLAGMLGGETLHELRTTLTEAELALSGGVSPRISPFADLPQIGSLMQRAGFALPVVDSEIVTVTYDSVFHLMHDLRGMGESNIVDKRSRKTPGKSLFMETARLYQEKFSDPDGRIRASFEVIFMIGWAPHESQQKPLRPGSAERRLADLLCTREIKTPV